MNLTKDQAIELIGGRRDFVHCFSNPGPGLLLGADYSWGEFLNLLDNAKEILKAGTQGEVLKHPLYISDGRRRLFFQRIESDDSRPAS